MADYEAYDWKVWLGYLKVYATMETDETLTDLILYGDDEVIYNEINFYDGSYF